MTAYIIRRLLLMIPTLWAIITLNFFVIQLAPGGPVEQAMAQLQGIDNSATDRVSGANQNDLLETNTDDFEPSNYRGSQGLDPAIIKEIEQRFGFDKPVWERYLLMLKNYLLFDFGDSFFKGSSVTDLIIERMPVSVSLGFGVPRWCI